MNPDNNWLQVRDLSKDLEVLTDIPLSTLEDLFKIVENLTIHKFIEKVLENNEPNNGKDYEIIIPYIGSLVISFDDKGKLSYSFVMRNSFYRKLKNSYKEKSSPLNDQLGEILGEDLLRRFNEYIDGKEISPEDENE